MTTLVFVDANVLIAGSGSRSGAGHIILMLGAFGLIQLVATRQGLDEAERNLRHKLPAALPVLAQILANVDLRVLDNPPPVAANRWAGSIEAADAPLVEAAVSAQVDYFLTLNTRHFTPAVAAASGLTIMTPGDFVGRLRALLVAGL